MSERTTTRYFCDRCSVELNDGDIAGRSELNVTVTGNFLADRRYPEKVQALNRSWKDLCPNCRAAVFTFFNPRAIQPKTSEINEARDFFQKLLDQRDEKNQPVYTANLTMAQAHWLLRKGYKI